MRSVKEYIEELEKTKSERTGVVLDGLEIYIDLWKRVLQNGTITDSQDVDEALEKIEEKGGLYKAAEG
ncbi:MAG TPA: hypothetical protein VFE91_06800 [Nitrososphaerales archaeon]|nr:hypothetical protein [Nitrososphaerales archaeon]